MNIRDVSRLSGLSTKQIDLAINRWGVTPHFKKVTPGSPREFTKADAFVFCVAGELVRMGLSWPAVREIIWSATAMVEVDPTTFEQRETFPGASRFKDAMLVVRNFDPDNLPEARFVERDELPKVCGDALIAIPATKIAKRIEAEVTAGE